MKAKFFRFLLRHAHLNPVQIMAVHIGELNARSIRRSKNYHQDCDLNSSVILDELNHDLAHMIATKKHLAELDSIVSQVITINTKLKTLMTTGIMEPIDEHDTTN